MSVASSVVLATARTFLNDDSATNWTDTALFPKLTQAHRELQTMLRLNDCPVMKKMSAALTITTGDVTIITPPSDLVEPIKLWEKATTDPSTAYVEMTERNPLPDQAQTGILIYWQWQDEIVNLIGATADRHIRMWYWRSLAIPTQNTDTIGFINGEMWLAPRVAAIAALSLGNQPLHDLCTASAKAAVDQVILANRGRMTPAQGSSSRP